VFQFEDVVGIIEGFGHVGEAHRLYEREHAVFYRNAFIIWVIGET
jgi:hypothetical protein